MKPGLFFRSARPDEASPSDRERLKHTYHIKTIIDLRTTTEHVEQAQKRGRAIPSAPAATPPDPAEPLKIPGIEYKDINFNGSAYSKSLIKKLTWSQTAKLAGLYVTGYRTQAISILGRNVMTSRGLTGLAEDSLQHCTAEVKQVFTVLADQAAYPVLVHCTQGKDRTGLTALLVLMLLHVPQEAIEKDYIMSESELRPERDEKVKELRSIGLPDDFADCPADWVKSVSTWLEERYGGVNSYLESCGVGEVMQQNVRQILGGP